MVELMLNSGEILRISGPASLSIVDGSVRVMGALWGKGSKIVIPKTRSYIVIANENSKIDLNVGEGSEISKVNASEEPTIEWEKVAEEIASKPSEYKIVMVIGGIECGKTTLSTILGNIAYSKGLKVAIIDGDVGQSDIGPPTFISMGFLKKNILELREVEVEDLVFIGDTTPYMYTTQISYGIRRLVESALSKGANLVIIDTDGWFKGVAALNYKVQMLEIVQPHIVLVLSSGNVKELLKLEKLKFNIKFLKAPQHRRERSREDRRRLRERAYTVYFKNAKRLKVKVDDIVWVNTLMFKGRRLTREELSTLKSESGIKHNILYGEIIDNRMVLVLDGVIAEEERSNIVSTVKKLYGLDHCIVRVKGFEKGLIACIVGERLKHLSPAIIEDIDFSSGVLILYTPWQKDVLGIQVGRVRLEVNGDRVVEVEKVRGDVIL